MGNQIPKDKSKSADINHLKFLNATFLQNNETMKTIIPLQSKNEFQKWQKNVEQIKPYQDPVLLLPKKFSFQQKTYCGNSGFVQIQYDNHSLILDDQIKQRARESKYFQQQQLCEKFKKINSKVGDIRPKNIFISQSTGAVKVSNLCSWPSETTNYNKTIFNHQITYLSPQEIKQAKQGRVQTKLDQFKAQSFTIGLTVLQSTILKDVESLYTQKKKSFNYNQLDQLLENLWKINIAQNKNQYQTYGVQLKTLITALCQVNPETRISSDQVYNLLKSFDSQILNLKHFKPNIPTYEKLVGISNRYYKQSTYNSHPQPFIKERPININQNYVEIQHKPTNYHHFMTQQKNKFPINYSEIKLSNDSFKSSFIPNQPKISIYQYSAPPINFNLQNRNDQQFKVANFSTIQVNKNTNIPQYPTITQIPQYPITQIPKQQLKKSYQIKTLNDQQSRFLKKSNPIEESNKNMDFLRHIDQQLKRSKQINR